VTPQRRTALVSVGAACALIALKLSTGLASGSLGLVSEAVHSGTDFVAALLTFFAVGVAVRPADRSHPYGHGKAEHLAALAEASVLVLVSVGVAAFAVLRLTGVIETEVDAAWWVFAVVAAVIVIDVSRTVVSLRAARRHSSAALLSNALHFGSDLAGTVAVLLGLAVAALGWPQGDSVAALFVSFLVVMAAVRLVGRFACTCLEFDFVACASARRPDDTSSTSSSVSLPTRLSHRGMPPQTLWRMRCGVRSPRRMLSSTSSRKLPARPRFASGRR
jgi:cation diffusion facilitator family transporter